MEIWLQEGHPEPEGGVCWLGTMTLRVHVHIIH
jgi:hypothetical protein